MAETLDSMEDTVETDEKDTDISEETENLSENSENSDISDADEDDAELSEATEEGDESLSRCPAENCEYGTWEGERGNSNFYPNENYTPPEKLGNTRSNPDNLNMKEIFDKYDVEKIPFKDGNPDFSEVSRGTVEIDNFSSERYGAGGNFNQGYEKLANERGCSQREVKSWMRDNNYTFHECPDCRTLQKVPNEIHANIRHSGGISVAKAEGGK